MTDSARDSSIQVPLPPALREFALDEAARHGMDVGAYVQSLIASARRRKAEEELEQHLLKALDSGEPVEMTADDWKQLEQEILDRAAAQKR